MRCCIDDILLPLLLSHLPLLPFSPFPASPSWFSNHYCLHPTPPNHLNLPLHYPCYYRFLASIVHFAFFRHHSALCSIPACTIQLVLPKLLFFLSSFPLLFSSFRVLILTSSVFLFAFFFAMATARVWSSPVPFVTSPPAHHLPPSLSSLISARFGLESIRKIIECLSLYLAYT